MLYTYRYASNAKVHILGRKKNLLVVMFWGLNRLCLGAIYEAFTVYLRPCLSSSGLLCCPFHFSIATSLC